jgi:hypothetical protein
MRNALKTTTLLSTGLAVFGAVSQVQACAVEDVSLVAGSYHVGERSYNAGTASRPDMVRYNETNPGVVAGVHCKALPRLISHWKLGYIAENSFGKPTTFIAVDNTLYENDSLRLSGLVGVVPTGYLKPKFMVGLSIEGKGPFALKTEFAEIRPQMTLLPGGKFDGTGDGAAVLLFSVKAVF